MAICGPLRKLLRSTFYCRKPSHYYSLEATPAPIQQLPIDVIRYILNRLPPAEAASLALSSKTILNAIGSNILRIERTEDRVQLLRHLEIFFPEHLLCYQCGKFHLRRPDKVHEHEGDTGCDRKNGRFRFNSYALNLPFTRVQEIMNRHRYGRRYGISVGSLNKRHIQTVTPFDRRVEQTKAKIVNDQLFIRTDIRFLSEYKNRDFKQNCRYCPHQKSENFRSSDFDYSKTTFIRCLECPTEIRWDSISCDLLAGFGKTRTTVWCNLGSCRSPFEVEWRALTTPSRDHNSRVYISQDDARYIHLF